MQIKVAAPEVDDQRNGRPDRSYVGEILLRSDADVGATRHGQLRQRGQDVLEPLLVRYEILRMECPARLRGVVAQGAEFLIGEPRCRGLSAERRRGTHESQP